VRANDSDRGSVVSQRGDSTCGWQHGDGGRQTGAELDAGTWQRKTIAHNA